ncbi:MAG: pilus assembly PilX N-terminal domain-containing protein, partial [Acidobacteria bacterium]|nr:pilus assembly PilX N-terminal domain-containing protein [Acidobacteriota bacterium]
MDQLHGFIDSRHKDQRGIALIMALFVLAILSLVGMTYMTSSTLETRINSNSRSSYPAFYAAEAGLEEGTYRLIGNAVNPIALSLVDAPTKVVYIRQSSSIVPTDSSSPYYDTEYSGSNFSTVTYATTNQSTNLMPYQWVKISMKTKRVSGHDVDNTGLTTNQDVPVYYDGAEYLYSPPTINPTKTGYKVYQITAFAQTSSGAAYKLRREISTAGFPGMPGAVYLPGPAPIYGAPNSNNFVVDGNDQGGGPAKPAIAVLNAVADAAVTGAIPGNRLDHYTGSGGWPDIQDVSSGLSSNLTTPQGLEDLVNTISPYANGT